MAVVSWTNEVIPGGEWTYNQENINYNQPTVDGIPVLYNSIGEATSWTLEDR